MTNSRLQLVSWHDQAVYIQGISGPKHNTEFGFQIFTAQWLRDHNHTGWHHSPNENANGLVGVWRKLCGVSSGFPDWIHPRSNTAVELKVGNGVLSQAQKIWMLEFGNYFVCRTFEEFKDAVKSTL